MANQVQMWAPRPDVVYCAASGTPYKAGGDASVLVWDYDVASVLPFGFSLTNPNPPTPPAPEVPDAPRTRGKRAGTLATDAAAEASTDTAPLDALPTPADGA